MKTLLTLCLAIIGLAGFASTKAEAAQTLPAVVRQNYEEVVVVHHRHHYHHYYHHRNYYYRHHRRIYY